VQLFHSCSCHPGLSIHEYRFLFIGAAVTILTALLRLALEIVQFCRHPLEYLLDWVNWLEIPLYLFSIMFTFVFATPCLCVYSWQWQIGVIAVFLGWIGLITFLQKWPLTGVYVLMFVNIIMSFLKIVFLALLLVIAFGLAFYMLLFEPDEMVSQSCILQLLLVSTVCRLCIFIFIFTIQISYRQLVLVSTSHNHNLLEWEKYRLCIHVSTNSNHFQSNSLQFQL